MYLLNIVQFCNLLFLDLDFSCSYNRYNRVFAYGQSKLANVLHANELPRLFKVLNILLGTDD